MHKEDLYHNSMPDDEIEVIHRMEQEQWQYEEHEQEKKTQQ